MNLTTSMCHAHLMWMLSQPQKFEQAIREYSASSPNFRSEGFNGYIETTVIFEIADIANFSKLYNEYYSLPDDMRSKWYSSLCIEANCR